MTITTTCPRCQQEKPENRAYCRICQTRLALENYYKKLDKPMPAIGPDWKLKSNNTIRKNRQPRKTAPTLCATCKGPKEPKKVYCATCKKEATKVKRKKSNRLQRDKKHSIAHKLVWIAKEAGVLVPTPCEVCGAEKTMAHHASYDLPLAVTWLCSRCHTKLHRDFEAYERGIVASGENAL